MAAVDETQLLVGSARRMGEMGPRPHFSGVVRYDKASPRAPGDDARRRAWAHSHGMPVVAADRQYGPAAQDLNHLEDVVRHHADDARCGTIRRLTPMRPIAREIVLGSGIAADQLAHFPAAPGRGPTIGDPM
jgi:hypothetical protein